jgi:hypothetical protein
MDCKKPVFFWVSKIMANGLAKVMFENLSVGKSNGKMFTKLYRTKLSNLVFWKVPKPLSKYTLSKRLIKHCQHKCQKDYCRNDCLKGMSKLPFNTNVSEFMSPHCRKNNQKHNILQAWASRPFSTVQKNIQQHPRSTATLDSHDL